MLNFNQQKKSSEITNISDYLKLYAGSTPDKPALLYPEKITYRELENKVNSHSSGLFNAGINAGTRTLVLVPAGTDFFVLIFSLLRIGAVPVMIDPGMGIKAMLTVLADLEAEAFIGIPKAHLLLLLFPHVFKTVRLRITTGIFTLKRTKKLKDIVRDNPGQFPSHSFTEDENAAIFFTSGSTGPAKGVFYTAGMLKNQIEVTRSQFKIGPHETDLCTFPLLGLFAICHGNSSVIADMDMMHPAKLDPAKIIANINEFGCTQMFGSPMILNKLAEYGLKRNIRLLSLLNIISAGAPVHQAVLESFSKLLPDDAVIHTPYGATEALPVTDITAEELLQIYSEKDDTENGICIGRPVLPLTVKIIDITDHPIESWDRVTIMPAGKVGEIVVKGPWVSTGYFRKSDADRFSKIPDMHSQEIWHRMGDLGKMDSHGMIWFYGRKSQRIITSDGTLYTIPCEAVFNHHPLVSRSALVGIDTSVSGIKKPVICIRLKKGIRPNKKIEGELFELGNSCNMTRIISKFLFIKEFPVDPRHNAKIYREKLAVWASKKIPEKVTL